MMLQTGTQVHHTSSPRPFLQHSAHSPQWPNNTEYPYHSQLYDGPHTQPPPSTSFFNPPPTQTLQQHIPTYYYPHTETEEPQLPLPLFPTMWYCISPTTHYPPTEPIATVRHSPMHRNPQHNPGYSPYPRTALTTHTTSHTTTVYTPLVADPHL